MSEVNLSFENGRVLFSHSGYDTMPKTGFHLHHGCEIYFLISGDVEYFIENKIYPVRVGDLIITNSDELHMVSFLSEAYYERYCLSFDPRIAVEFSTSQTTLLSSFTNCNKGNNNKVSMTPQQLENIIRILKHMEYLGTSKPFGSDVLFHASFLELLVTVNDMYDSFCHNDSHKTLPSKLTPIFQYIDTHLDSDLSLDMLGKLFFINKHYLRKLFKSHTGFNLFDYILHRRIAKAKILLKDGLNLHETMEACGFNDYCNFIRTFKKIVGVSPGKYGRSF